MMFWSPGRWLHDAFYEPWCDHTLQETNQKGKWSFFLIPSPHHQTYISIITKYTVVKIKSVLKKIIHQNFAGKQIFSLFSWLLFDLLILIFNKIFNHHCHQRSTHLCFTSSLQSKAGWILFQNINLFDVRFTSPLSLSESKSILLPFSALLWRLDLHHHCLFRCLPSSIHPLTF